MPWLRTDDRFHEDPDLDYVSPEAVCLDKCAASWSSQNLTDGFIPSMRVTKLHGFSREAIVQLTTACTPGNKPWWLEVEGGYQIRSFLKYNFSKEQVLAERAKGRDRANRSYQNKSSGDSSGEEARNNDHSSPEDITEIDKKVVDMPLGVAEYAENSVPPISHTVEPKMDSSPEDLPEEVPKKRDSSGCSSGSLPIIPLSHKGISELGEDSNLRATGDHDPPWWDWHDDRLARDVALGIRTSRNYEQFEPPLDAVLELIEFAREFAPDDDAVRSVVEAFRERAATRRKPEYSQPVVALKKWISRDEAVWRQVRRQREIDQKYHDRGSPPVSISERSKPKDGLDFYLSQVIIPVDRHGRPVESEGKPEFDRMETRFSKLAIIDGERTQVKFDEEAWFDARMAMR